MAFVDILTSQLYVLGFLGLLIVYLVGESYLMYKRGNKHSNVLGSGSIPMALLGGYALITGLYGQFTWPLPGSYNILFYDVYTLMGLLMVGFAWAFKNGSRMSPVGFLSLLLGLMVLLYGVFGYLQGLTEEPILLLLLYIGYGFAGILGFPVTVMLDRAKDGIKNRSKLWIALVLLFSLTLFIGSLTSLAIASLAVPAHLLSPP